MPSAGPTSTVSLASVPTIDNLAVTPADTEVPYTFPDNTYKFSLRGRTPGKIQFAFVAGDTSSKFFTVIPAGYFAEDQLDLSGVTIYLRTNVANQVYEILSWQGK